MSVLLCLHLVQKGGCACAALYNTRPSRNGAGRARDGSAVLRRFLHTKRTPPRRVRPHVCLFHKAPTTRKDSHAFTSNQRGNEGQVLFVAVGHSSTMLRW